MTRALLFVVLLGGCGAVGVQPPLDGSTRALVLGAGDDVFSPYADGDDVTLVEGAQGGFHVWMRYAFDGTPGADVTLERRARRVADGELVLRSTAQIVLEQESAPMPMFMCPAPAGLSVIEQPIDFEMRISDGTQVIADQHVTLIAHCPTENFDFCMRICTG